MGADELEGSDKEAFNERKAAEAAEKATRAAKKLLGVASGEEGGSGSERAVPSKAEVQRTPFWPPRFETVAMWTVAAIVLVVMMMMSRHEEPAETVGHLHGRAWARMAQL